MQNLSNASRNVYPAETRPVFEKFITGIWVLCRATRIERMK